jgi:hypothetical protein
MAGRSKHFDPKKKAKQFPSGRHTATETGAKQEARRNFDERQGAENVKKVMKASKTSKDFEDLIGGK